MIGGPLFQKTFTSAGFFVNYPSPHESIQEVAMAGVDMGMTAAAKATEESYVHMP